MKAPKNATGKQFKALVAEYVLDNENVPEVCTEEYLRDLRERIENGTSKEHANLFSMGVVASVLKKARIKIDKEKKAKEAKPKSPNTRDVAFKIFMKENTASMIQQSVPSNTSRTVTDRDFNLADPLNGTLPSR